MKYKKYLRTGFWLTVPILLWNVAFAGRLPIQYQPEIFWQDIPNVVKVGENLLRLVIFVMAVFFSIDLTTKAQKQGLIWYVGGTAVYFLSWIPLLLAPESAWSQSLIGFSAPAYTPLLWLIGMGLLGEQFYFSGYYRAAYYIVPAVLFTFFHCTHVVMVYLHNF